MRPHLDQWDADNPEYVGRLCGQMFRMAELLRDWHYEYFQTPDFLRHYVYKDSSEWPTLEKHYFAACYHAKGAVMELDERRRPGDDFDYSDIAVWLRRVRQGANRMRYKRMNRHVAQIPVGKTGHTIGILLHPMKIEEVGTP